MVLTGGVVLLVLWAVVEAAYRVGVLAGRRGERATQGTIARQALEVAAPRVVERPRRYVEFTTAELEALQAIAKAGPTPDSWRV